MGLLQKILVPFTGLVLALWFYSGKEDFKPGKLFKAKHFKIKQGGGGEEGSHAGMGFLHRNWCTA